MKPYIVIVLDTLNNQAPWPGALDLAPPTLSKFYVKPRNKVHFSVAVIAKGIKTLHSNCAWHTLWAHTMTRCPWPTFHRFHWTLWKFYVKSRNKVHFSAAAMAVSMKPCIVVVLDTLFKHTPWPFFFAWPTLHAVVISPNAGAISTSAEFLFFWEDQQNLQDLLFAIFE